MDQNCMEQEFAQRYVAGISSKIPTKVGCHILVNGIKAGSQVSSCHLEQYRED